MSNGTMQLKEKDRSLQKACEKGTFHITQLIQVNVFFFFYRPQLKKEKKKKWTKKINIKLKKQNKTKKPPTSAGHYVSPKPILLFFGVSVISIQQLYQQINYNVQNNIFLFVFFVIKTQHSQSISTIIYVQILQGQSLSV